MPENPLAGRRILLCRPAGRADGLLQALQAHGASAQLLPVLEIEPLPPGPAQLDLVQRLDQFEAVVALSPSAARLGVALLEQWWPQWPQGPRWLAVGRATASILQEAGLSVLVPAHQDQRSEGLLALPVLQQARRILLLKGEGGRQLLRQQLGSRGNEVAELVLYRRQTSVAQAAALQSLLRAGAVDAVVAMSGETLASLRELAGSQQKQLEWVPVLVPGARVAVLAAEQGFRHVFSAEGTDEQALVSGLRDLFTGAES